MGVFTDDGVGIWSSEDDSIEPFAGNCIDLIAVIREHFLDPDAEVNVEAKALLARWSVDV